MRAVSATDPQGRLVLALLGANHEVIRACNRVYRRFGVTHHQVQILRILAAAGKPLSQGEVGDGLLVSRANLSGLVGRMADGGLLLRHTPRRDRRVVMLGLTDRGQQVLEGIEPIRQTVESILFADLDEPQLDRVTELLESVARNAEDIG